jgi:hypothetical protein
MYARARTSQCSHAAPRHTLARRNVDLQRHMHAHLQQRGNRNRRTIFMEELQIPRENLPSYKEEPVHAQRNSFRSRRRSLGNFVRKTATSFPNSRRPRRQRHPHAIDRIIYRVSHGNYLISPTRQGDACIATLMLRCTA